VSAPERIGRYRVLEPIGRGGMGSVYKAHDPTLDRMVAIKVMAEDAEAGAEAKTRFLREAQSAARLNHPNIITVFELGEDQGRVFIVMELLEGDPLSRVISRVPPLPLRRKLNVMVQICEGLAFAHQRGVVHRDVKPANVFVLQNGHVKILDFGIARVGSSELTRTGLLMGTPNYMSPEQARGRRTDARSDIFSVGVVFYELLSGRKPFVGDDYFETLDRVRSEDPAPLGELAPGLPPPLVAAVQRALAKDPAARYQTLEDMKHDLLSVAELASPATVAAEDLRETVDRKFAELLRLHRRLVAAIGSAALEDDTLPLADPGTSGMGLETVLRDLDLRNERLKALARTVERLEPVVARGVAAFERASFAEAIAELDRVLKEIPLHQRARDYRERARLEEMRERTVKSAPALDTGTPVTGGVTAAPTPSPETAVTGTTRQAAVGRPRLVLAGVAAVVVSAGSVWVVMRPPAPPVAPAPPEQVAPAPAPVVAPPTVIPAPPVVPPSPPAAIPPATPPRAVTPAPPKPGAPGEKAKPPAAKPSEVAKPSEPAKPREAVKPSEPAKPPEAVKPGKRQLTAEEIQVVQDALAFAQVWMARGDTQRALVEYRRVLALDPDNAEARQGVVDAQTASQSQR
jgi:tetratricopeptide (TPR) repeat protein